MRNAILVLIVILTAGFINTAFAVFGNTSFVEGYEPESHGLLPTFLSISIETSAFRVFAGRSSLCISKSWFKGFAAFPRDTALSHAFNLAVWNTVGRATLDVTAPLVVCKYLRKQKANEMLLEVGNEPDMYSIRGIRPAWYTVENYLSEWREQTARIESRVNESCPEMNGKFKYIFPSASSPDARLNGANILQSLTRDDYEKIGMVSVHHAMANERQPGVTVEGTLMNHTAVSEAIRKHVLYAIWSAGFLKAPYVIGELNSVNREGARRITDTYGTALWALDFSLCAASSGIIKRVYFHQSIQTPAAAWWPHKPTKTKPIFYGMLAAATFLANSSSLVVKEFDVGAGQGQRDGGDGRRLADASGYKGYLDERLHRVAILNLEVFEASHKKDQQRKRPRRLFVFDSEESNARWIIKRLTAPAVHAQDWITFNGLNYNAASMSHNGDGARDVHLDTDEPVWSDAEGRIEVTVAASEAVVLIKVETPDLLANIKANRMTSVPPPNPLLVLLNEYGNWVKK
ncbi:hypothetical protein E4U21_005757 [Claviceps maximensis]|nr:hypothetical protein E4U21_005757 [Claviceps maximensis]